MIDYSIRSAVCQFGAVQSFLRRLLQCGYIVGTYCLGSNFCVGNIRDASHYANGMQFNFKLRTIHARRNFYQTRIFVNNTIKTTAVIDFFFSLNGCHFAKSRRHCESATKRNSQRTPRCTGRNNASFFIAFIAAGTFIEPRNHRCGAKEKQTAFHNYVRDCLFFSFACLSDPRSQRTLPAWPRPARGWPVRSGSNIRCLPS